MEGTNTRFTALGMSGSGKTCYVLGMYYQMITGYKGFSLKAGSDSITRLESWMDNLDDETGTDRFPAGTALTAVDDYEFKLKYALQDIMTFNWLDYGGGTLKARESNPEAFEQLNESIEESTALYIFLDGELLCHEDIDECIKALKKSARTLNGFLLDFSENHMDRMPPIVVVITKADLCAEYLGDNDKIRTIMQESFGALMSKGIRCYVASVSLGGNISDDDYSGEVDPINMHIPFFIGIYHQFLAFCCALKMEIEEEEQAARSRISDRQNTIAHERSKTGIGFLDRWLCDSDRISACMRQIGEAEDVITSNKELLIKYKKLMFEVANQLLRDSSNFTMYQDGIETDFRTDEVLDL